MSGVPGDGRHQGLCFDSFLWLRVQGALRRIADGKVFLAGDSEVVSPEVHIRKEGIGRQGLWLDRCGGSGLGRSLKSTCAPVTMHLKHLCFDPELVEKVFGFPFSAGPAFPVEAAPVAPDRLPPGC